MLRAGEDELLCDFAEHYHIYDIRAYKPSYIGTLAQGLSNDSRIKCKMSGVKAPASLLLQASIVDRLSMLVWMQTKDAQSGKNKPHMIVDALLGNDKPKEENNVKAFATAEEFEARRKKLIGR